MKMTERTWNTTWAQLNQAIKWIRASLQPPSGTVDPKNAIPPLLTNAARKFITCVYLDCLSHRPLKLGHFIVSAGVMHCVYQMPDIHSFISSTCSFIFYPFIWFCLWGPNFLSASSVWYLRVGHIQGHNSGSHIITCKAFPEAFSE